MIGAALRSVYAVEFPWLRVLAVLLSSLAFIFASWHDLLSSCMCTYFARYVNLDCNSVSKDTDM